MSAVVCSSDQHLCRDDITCISKAIVCDGKEDCADGDDEEHCDSSKYNRSNIKAKQKCIKL